MTTDEIMNEIKEKYSEWLEYAGEESPALIMKILCYMVMQEREQNNFLKKRVEYERFNTKY